MAAVKRAGRALNELDPVIGRHVDRRAAVLINGIDQAIPMGRPAGIPAAQGHLAAVRRAGGRYARDVFRGVHEFPAASVL